MPAFTDKNGDTRETTKKRHIQFIEDMENADVPWRWYDGRFHYSGPAAVTSDRHSDQYIIRATHLGLTADSMGLYTILYPA